MNGAAIGSGGCHRRRQHGIAREFARRDRVIDASVVLVDDAAGANVEMADFGVPHLTRRQPDLELGRIDRRVRTGCKQPIPVRHPGAGDRIVRCVGAAAETVQNQQDDRSGEGLEDGIHRGVATRR
jgi:hypothetical protein